MPHNLDTATAPKLVSRRVTVLGAATAALLILGVATAPMSASAAEQQLRDVAQARSIAVVENSHRVGIGASGLDIAAAQNTAIADRAVRAEQARIAAEAAAAAAAAEAEAAALAAQAAADADAAAAAAAAASSGDDSNYSGGSDDDSAWSAPSAGVASSAPAPAADLGVAPANDNCGPCAGAALVPVTYDGVTYWGCPA